MSCAAAPTNASAPYRCDTFSITPTAPGTVIVISSSETPPSRIASIAIIASSADCARTTGMMPMSRIV